MDRSTAYALAFLPPVGDVRIGFTPDISILVTFVAVSVALRHSLARPPLVEQRVLRCGDVMLDVSSREVTVGGIAADLLTRQFDLLAALIRNEEKLLNYSALVRFCWGLETTEIGSTRCEQR